MMGVSREATPSGCSLNPASRRGDPLGGLVMAGALKRHEIDRLMNVAVVLGWELVQEVFLEDGVKVELKRVLPPELLRLDVDLDIPASAQ